MLKESYLNMKTSNLQNDETKKEEVSIPNSEEIITFLDNFISNCLFNTCIIDFFLLLGSAYSDKQVIAQRFKSLQITAEKKLDECVLNLKNRLDVEVKFASFVLINLLLIIK